MDLYLSCRYRQVIQANAHCHGHGCFTRTVAVNGVHPSALLSHPVALQSVLGQKKSQKGAIRHPRRKFPWAQQYKICEISTHEKISLTDRRAQAYRHLGGETCCVWVFQESQLIAPTVLAVPGPGVFPMSRAMAAHALCGWAGWQLHWHTPFFTIGLLDALHSYRTHLAALWAVLVAISLSEYHRWSLWCMLQLFTWSPGVQICWYCFPLAPQMSHLQASSIWSSHQHLSAFLTSAVCSQTRRASATKSVGVALQTEAHTWTSK